MKTAAVTDKLKTSQMMRMELLSKETALDLFDLSIMLITSSNPTHTMASKISGCMKNSFITY